MQVLLANPRGFCAGVVRAIGTVERALALHGAPVYVFHEIVHNGHVVDELRGRGAVFVQAIEAIPRGAVTVFSAHGVSNAVVTQARSRALRVIDATCPLVAKVHAQAQRYVLLGHTLIIIGHAGHEEVEGTIGAVDGPVHLVTTADDVRRLRLPADARPAYVTQTTLSLDDARLTIEALQQRFPGIVGPQLDDICYASQNRQNAVHRLAQADLVLVVGARNSSNSRRLREVAAQRDRPAHLVQDAGEIDPAWLEGVRRVGICAGASTPELLVQGVCARLRALGARAVLEIEGTPETVMFRLPAVPLPRAA